MKQKIVVVLLLCQTMWLWGDDRAKDFHLLGWHFSMATGNGLMYRHYRDSFAWQVSFFPSYYQSSSSEDNSFYILLNVGTFEQFFLKWTKVSSADILGALFIWGGGFCDWEVSRELYENIRFSLAGGIGFETIFYSHWVFDLAGGYRILAMKFGGKNEWEKPMVNFSVEASVGYRF